MHEDTAPHDIIPLDIEPMRVDKLLAQGHAANVLCAVLMLAAIVLAVILLGRAWPPRTLETAPSHSSWTDRNGQRLAALDVPGKDRGPDHERE